MSLIAFPLLADKKSTFLAFAHDANSFVKETVIPLKIIVMIYRVVHLKNGFVGKDHQVVCLCLERPIRFSNCLSNHDVMAVDMRNNRYNLNTFSPCLIKVFKTLLKKGKTSLDNRIPLAIISLGCPRTCCNFT